MKARLTYVGIAETGPAQGGMVVKCQEGDVLSHYTENDMKKIEWNAATTHGLAVQEVPIGRVLEFRVFNDEV